MDMSVGGMPLNPLCLALPFLTSQLVSLVSLYPQPPETIVLLLPTPLLYAVPFTRVFRASLVVQTVKRLLTMWETRVQSVGWEDPLEKEMATYSSTLAWKIPWEEPSRLQSMGLQRVGHD